MAEKRQATTLRLTRSQLKWIKDEAFERRTTQQDVIEAALVAAGAPAATRERITAAMLEVISPDVGMSPCT